MDWSARPWEMVDIDYNIVTYVNQVFMLLICEEAGLQQKIVKFKQIGTIFRRRRRTE